MVHKVQGVTLPLHYVYAAVRPPWFDQFTETIATGSGERGSTNNLENEERLSPSEWVPAHICDFCRWVYHNREVDTEVDMNMGAVKDNQNELIIAEGNDVMVPSEVRGVCHVGHRALQAKTSLL